MTERSKLREILTVFMIAAACLMTGRPAAAQDIHFSQPDINPILFNPAYSGFFDGSGRFAITYRNQWASVSKPFQTMAACGEFAIKRRRFQRDGLSAGLSVFNDRAGTLQYGTTAANLILSYYKSLNRFNNNFVSIGIQAGMAQSGYDPAEALLRDRDEIFGRTKETYPLFGIGAAWYYHPHDFFEVKVALSGQNLNRPSVDYIAGGGYVERRFNLYCRADWRFAAWMAVEPLLAVQLQHNNSELLVGADLKWYLSEITGNDVAMSAGAAIRTSDALIFSIGTEWSSMLVSFAYDANISKLVAASGGVGAFEVSAVYRLSKKKLYQRKALPCPII